MKIESDAKKRKDLKIVTGQLTGMCLFVTSTFGNGEPPVMASSMAKWVDKLLNQHEDDQYENLRAADVVLGNENKSHAKAR